MDYNQYSAEELAADPYFIEWIKLPTDENIAFWEDWLRTHPHKVDDVALAQKLVNVWMIKLPMPSDGSAENVWEKIQANIVASEEKALEKSYYALNWQYFRQCAAVFIGLILCAASWYWVSTHWHTTHYATGGQETKTILLPDGSTVTLNANSSLSYDSEWTGTAARKVYLAGEAFFSVTHKANHQPFIVQTPDQLQVEVLGTTFTVSERESNTQVVLNSGKVSLRADSQMTPLTMLPGEMVRVSKNSKTQILRQKVNPAVYSAWKDNQFIFDNTPIGDIADILKREFGYQVYFADSIIKNRKLTFRMDNRDVNLLFAVLAESHDLAISQENNRITIAGKKLTQ